MFSCFSPRLRSSAVSLQLGFAITAMTAITRDSGDDGDPERLRRYCVVRYRFPAKPYRVVGQAIGFLVLLAWDVRNAELQRSRQLAAHPVQGIEARAAAGVLAGHLLDHQFGIAVNAERGGIELQG